MKYFEYGKGNEELVVMLHGGGVSYKDVEPTVQAVAKKYHVVLVAYDGFNPAEPDTEFVSVQNEAERLGDYIVCGKEAKTKTRDRPPAPHYSEPKTKTKR